MFLRVTTFGCWLLSISLAMAQPPGSRSIPVPLNGLSAFRPAQANWSVVGDVSADLSRNNTLNIRTGTGVLANLVGPTNTGQAYNLLTQLEHGDLDLELDYMMAKGSNSGVYLQGCYEVQLFDSWGVKNPKVVDNGSIYERWDDKRPEAQRGYEGYPARQNVSRAPGLWQHLKVSFQAPRFDANGHKTENARMLRVELNGVTIHENVELTGPTRSAAFTDEKPTGPIMLQGDHGSVAFRNIRYIPFDKSRPELVNLSYAVYKGKFDKEPDYAKLTPDTKGTTSELTPAVSRTPNEFLIRYQGTLHVNEPGEYTVNVGIPGGGGILRVNNQTIVPLFEENGSGKVMLPAGDLPFELLYGKMAEWVQPSLQLSMAGPGIREFLMTSSLGESPETDPILIDATQTPILRSFMDLPGVPNGKGGPFRVVHAISVSSPEQVHYTYDLDNGAVVQLWRGQFLDATPMWNDRGDGSSRPTGMVQRFGKPALFIAKLTSTQAEWPKDTIGTGFRPKGYVLDDNDLPAFRYQTNGVTISDQVRALDNGQGIRREVTVQNAASNLFARLAEGTSINALESGLYVVDGLFYIRVDSQTVHTVRTINGRQELIAPVSNGKLSYSILF